MINEREVGVIMPREDSAVGLWRDIPRFELSIVSPFYTDKV
jgi:hypothetical protein